MIMRSSILPLATTVFLGFGGTAVSASPEDCGPTVIVDKSIAEMAVGNWQESLTLSENALQILRQNEHIPVGPVYYRKGICEMKLQRWSEAMNSFELCYMARSKFGKIPAGNPYQKLALLKWGEAAVGAGNWALALTRFQKFIEERDKALDLYQKGSFYINVSICHLKLGDLSKGIENLEIALRNKAAFPTPEEGIVAGFQALVTAAIARHNEQALIDFMQVNSGDLCMEPILMSQYSGAFLKMAAETMAVDMERATFALFELVPATAVVLDDLRARLKKPAEPSDRAAMEEQLTALEEANQKGEVPEVVKLSATAYFEEKKGNLQGAFAAYQQLEEHYSNSAKREENLYHLVRTASLVSLPEEARKYTELYIKSFPASPRIPELTTHRP